MPPKRSHKKRKANSGKSSAASSPSDSSSSAASSPGSSTSAQTTAAIAASPPKRKSRRHNLQTTTNETGPSKAAEAALVGPPLETRPLHAIQSLDEADPPIYADTSRRLPMTRSKTVCDNARDVKLCEDFYERYQQLCQEFLPRLKRLAEGQYGENKDGADVYQVKRLIATFCASSSSSSSSSSSCSSSDSSSFDSSSSSSSSSSSASSSLSSHQYRQNSAEEIAGVQLTRLSTACPQLAAATTEAQQKILNEISKRQADIEGISAQVAALSEQIADEEDEEEAERLSKEMLRLSQMKGKHKKKIRELESLQEISVPVEVESRCVRLVLSQEEALHLRTELKTVPAKQAQEEPPARYLYVMGGRAAGGNRLASVERFGMESQRWEVLEEAPLNSVRSSCAAAVLDGQVHVAGGTDGKTYLSTVERFVQQQQQQQGKEDGRNGEGGKGEEGAEQKGRWEVLPARLQTGRDGCAAAVLEGALYVLGGRGAGGQVLASVERYDAERALWELVAPMTQARSALAAAVLDGKLYSLGGSSTVSAADSLKTVERYDAVRNVWEAVADMSTERFAGAAAVLEGKLYVMGGGNRAGQILSSVECYEPSTNEWRLVAPMHKARSSFAASVLGGRLYVMGGGFGAYSSMERYDAERGEWEELEAGAGGEAGAGPLHQGRYWHAGVSL